MIVSDVLARVMDERCESRALELVEFVECCVEVVLPDLQNFVKMSVVSGADPLIARPRTSEVLSKNRKCVVKSIHFFYRSNLLQFSGGMSNGLSFVCFRPA